MKQILESAIQKLGWASKQSHWSVDVSSEEAAALIDELNRLTALETASDSCAKCGCDVLPSNRPVLCTNCEPFWSEESEAALTEHGEVRT